MRPATQPPGKTSSDGTVQLIGCAVVAVLVAAFSDNWRLEALWFLVALAWVASLESKRLWARAIHPLAVSWLIALSILLPLDLIVKLTQPEETEPFLNAYERTVLQLARILGHFRLDWGWTLVALAALMAIVVLVPRARPVSAFLATTKYTSRVLGVIGVLSSFTFFAAIAAPHQGAVVLKHAQAALDGDLAREQEQWRQTMVVESMAAALRTPDEAARIFAWAEQVGEASHNEQVREELIRDLAGITASADDQEVAGEPLTLAGADESLARQRSRTAKAESELDKGFQQILAKTADLPRKELVNNVMTKVITALGSDQSLAAEIAKGLIGNLTSEALRDSTKPIIDRLVSRLREQFWSKSSSESSAAVVAAAQGIRRHHSAAASSWAEGAAERADEAQHALDEGSNDLARSYVHDAQLYAGRAQYEAALANDIAGVDYFPYIGVIGVVPRIEDPRFAKIEEAINRVRSLEEVIRARDVVEGKGREIEVP